MTWISVGNAWLWVNPWGLRNVLRWVRDRWGNPPVYITENGRPDIEGPHDIDRIYYHRNYTNELLKGLLTFFSPGVGKVFYLRAGLTIPSYAAGR